MRKNDYQMKYSDEIKHPLWQKKRADILKRDNYTCQLCGDTETQLHINHLLYQKRPWEVPDEFLQTLCAHCHWIFHKHVDNQYPAPIKVIKSKIPGLPTHVNTFSISNYGFVATTFDGLDNVGHSIGITYANMADIIENIPAHKMKELFINYEQ